MIIVMGSAAETVRETCEFLNAQGERSASCRSASTGHSTRAPPRRLPANRGQDRRPGSHEGAGRNWRAAFPRCGGRARAKRVAVDERARMPRVIGGRYGLSSKEFTPGMVAGVFDELAEKPRGRFTVGINDNVSGHSLAYDAASTSKRTDVQRAMFFGSGADGTVGANKNTIKIIGRGPPVLRAGLLPLRLQEIRLADSVASPVRVAADPITLSHSEGQFVACHQFNFVERDRRAAPSGRRSDLPAQQPATRPTRCGTICRGSCRSRSSRKDSASL